MLPIRLSKAPCLAGSGLVHVAMGTNLPLVDLPPARHQLIRGMLQPKALAAAFIAIPD